MAQRLSGIWFKLVEGDGFYLGILIVPLQVALNIEDKGRWRVAKRAELMPDVNVSFMDFIAADHIMRDAIMIFGITVSDINKEPGFAFIPSAEYMQRGPAVLTQPAVRRANTEAVNNRFTGLEFANE